MVLFCVSYFSPFDLFYNFSFYYFNNNIKKYEIRITAVLYSAFRGRHDLQYQVNMFSGKYCVDMLIVIGNRGVVIEIDEGGHRGKGHDIDRVKDMLLKGSGYSVLRIDPRVVMNGDVVDERLVIDLAKQEIHRHMLTYHFNGQLVLNDLNKHGIAVGFARYVLRGLDSGL